MLPEFLIIGAQKGGTTTLFSLLSQHPELIGGTKKELRFFHRDYTKGISWYESRFPESAAGGHAFEASPGYLTYPEVPARVRKVLPDARFIVLLRDPAERAFSRYRSCRVKGWETLPFKEALEAEQEDLESLRCRLHRPVTAAMRALGGLGRRLEHRWLRARFGPALFVRDYLGRGLYAEHLGRWFRYFPRNRFLILESEEFFADTPGVLEKVCAFLKIAPEHEFTVRRLNRTPLEEEMPENARRWLLEYFRPRNLALEALTGQRFSWTARGR
jgi:sulfotransferase family protein